MATAVKLIDIVVRSTALFLENKEQRQQQTTKTTTTTNKQIKTAKSYLSQA